MTSLEPHRDLNSTPALYSALQRRQDHQSIRKRKRVTDAVIGLPCGPVLVDSLDYGTPWERSRRVRINKPINPKTVARVAVIDYLPL
jgi:hypothetical protein